MMHIKYSCIDKNFEYCVNYLKKYLFLLFYKHICLYSLYLIGK